MQDITDGIIRLAGIVIGSLGAVAVAKIQFNGKSKQIKEYEAEKKELLKRIDELKKDQEHFNEIKKLFDIIYNQYRIEFKNNPEQLSMLRDLKVEIEK